MNSLTHSLITLRNEIGHWAFIGLFSLMTVIAPAYLQAQVTAYTYSTSTGALLDSMTGSTQLIGVSVDDSPSALTGIGFTFVYDGVSYDSFSVTPDGFLKLGSPATTSQFTNSITSTSNLPKIMPLWDDLATGTTGQVRYVVTGSAPNRILKVEWFVTVPRNTAGAANSRFQVWLYETTHVIEMVYENGGNATSASVGINSTAPVTFQSITTSTHTVSTSTANNTNTAWPGNGRMYRFVPPVPCTGIPAPGNTLSSANPVCSGVNFTLSLSGSPISGTGITYQWQSSPDGSTWTDILGATSSTLTTNQMAATYYQCVVTCTNSSQSAASTPLQVNLKLPNLCYCASNATSTADTKIDSVSFNTISVSTAPNLCETYTNNTHLSTQLMTGNSYPLFIKNGSCSGSHFAAWVSVYIDYNQNGDFTDPGEQVYTFGPTTGLNTIPLTIISIPGGATLGVTGMRIVFTEGLAAPPPCGTYTFGETEDYHVEIVAGTACTGTPAPGNTLSSANPVCSGANFTLSLSGSPISGTGITYQWQSSPDGSTWTDILGASNPTLTTNQLTATYYQCVVTCTNSSQSAASTPLQVLMNGSFCECGGYCIPASSGSACVTNVTLNMLNNTTAGCSAGNYSLQGATTSVETGVTYSLSVSTDADAIVSVWIDYNQDGTFDATEWAQVYATGTTGSVNITIPISATLGETRMRIRSRLSGNPNGNTDACTSFGSGEAEDYCITLIAGSACAGTPAPGNTLSSANPVCSGANFTLSLSGSPISGTGITYQWQSSPDGSTWTDILGASNPTLTTNQLTATYYQCVVTCTNSSQSAASTPLQVTMDVPTNCYCAAGAISTNFEKISNVEFNTINNPSASTAGYEDFTSVSTTVNTGGTYTFTGSISGGFSDDEIIVWIDYNQDGDFDDPGEEVYNSPTGIGPHSGNITIPLTATIGATRMRVRLHDSVLGPNTTPCGNSSFGQVEDYTVIISSCTPVTWYQDSDGDNFGNPMMTLSSCTQPMGYVSDNTDCNDSNSNVYPGAPEICNNSIDDDCDTTVDETLITWTGAGDGVNWTDGANWNNGGAEPQACNDIVIPAGADVTVPAGANVVGRTLDVNLSAVLTVALTAIMTIMP